MDRSSLFLCTINKEYLDKVDGKGKLGQRDNCKFEFTCSHARGSNTPSSAGCSGCLPEPEPRPEPGHVRVGLAVGRRDQPHGHEARGAARHQRAVH